MEEILNQLIDTSTIPLFTALLLGLLTSVSPCTFTTNVMVLAFIGKDVEDGKRSFINGLVYIIGRIVTYTLLGVFCIFIIREGASTFNVQTFVSENGGYVLGPTFVLFGLFLLFGEKIPLKKFGFHATERSKQLTGTFGAFVFGVAFRLGVLPDKWRVLFRDALAYVSGRNRWISIPSGLCHRLQYHCGADCMDCKL